MKLQMSLACCCISYAKACDDGHELSALPGDDSLYDLVRRCTYTMRRSLMLSNDCITCISSVFAILDSHLLVSLVCQDKPSKKRVFYARAQRDGCLL